MQFRILGPLEIEVDGTVMAPSRRQERGLLAVLLLDANRLVSVDRLAEILWDDGDSPKRIRGAVQGYVSRVRAILSRVIHDQGIELTYSGDGYRLVVPPELVDAHRFRMFLDHARQVTDVAERAAQLLVALELWRGPALVDAVSGRARERLCSGLEEQRLIATEEYLSANVALGREQEILPQLASIANDNPGREKLIELYMRALYQAGRKVEALGVYGRVRAYMADELGIDPGPALRELHQAVLRDEVPIHASEPEPRSAPVSRAVPRQLPRDLTSFVGRVAHLERLDALLRGAEGTAAPVLISAVGGVAGVGKTTLAVHWAHRVADSFPDGHLYLNLRGYDPYGSPMRPGEAVRALLSGLEVDQARIPGGLDAQLGLYRTLMASRRVLLVLDNARDAAQVRPLLPGAPGCFVLVTSRDQLSSLVALDGIHSLTLNTFAFEEAEQLLERRLGTDRVFASPAATDYVIRLCAGLPLALAVVAARAVIQPSSSLRELAEELRSAGSELEGLSGVDEAADVRTVFSWSYHALSVEAARLFRLLGLHAGPEIGIAGVASLLGAGDVQARRLSAELVAANMLTERGAGRYTMHDLLRAYAAELTRVYDAENDRDEAYRRLVDYYLHTAHAAALLMYPARAPLILPVPEPGATASSPAGIDDAVAWLTTERDALIATVIRAASTGYYSHAWRLAWALAPFLDNEGLWYEQLAVQNAAMDAARHEGDPVAQAYIFRFLGQVHSRLGNWNEARINLRQALDRYATLGNLAGQAAAHHSLGIVSGELGDYEEAIDHAKQSLGLCRSAANRTGEAGALENIGWAYVELGDYQQALSYTRDALHLWQEVGSPNGEAETWTNLGYIHGQLNQHEDAVACQKRAIELFDKAGDRHHMATAFERLGDSEEATGDHDAARTAWQEAASILERLGDPGWRRIRAKLAAT